MNELGFGVENVEIGSDGGVSEDNCTLCEKPLFIEDETHWIASSLNKRQYHSTCFYHIAWAIQRFLTEYGIDIREGASSGSYN